MKFKSHFSIFIFALLLACSSKNDTPPEVIMEEEEEIVITDPFYASLNEESSLDDYWEVFKNDAIRSGRLDPGQNRTVSLFFGDEPDFASGITAEHAGRAFSVCNNEVISFEIIESFWEDYTIVQRLYTFYHEAGHARYNFRHPCEFGESCNIDTSDLPIMWRSIPLGNTTFEEFVEDKNNFFRQNWEGIRYFDCTTN